MAMTGIPGPRPLRPLTLGGLIEEMLRLYQQNFVSLIAIVAIVQVAVAVVVGLLGLIAAGSAVSGVFVVAFLAGILAAVVYVVAIFLQAGALTLAIADDYLGQPITVQRAYEGAQQRLGGLIGTSLLIGLIVAALSITIIGIPVAIWLGIRWVFSSQIVMLEGQAATSAMSRSADLVRNYWWRTFGILLLVFIAIGLVDAIISGIFGRIAFIGGLINLIVQILIAPLYTAIVTLLYFDMRVRKENLTHDVISASMPGPGPAPAGGAGPATVI